MTPDEFEDRLESFFRFFRTRLANLDKMSTDPATDPERNVLVAAALDSLAKYWWAIFGGGPGIKEKLRMQAFLVACSTSDVFQRCCLIQLRKAAKRKGSDSLKFLNDMLRTWEGDGRVHTWRDDPFPVADPAG